MTPPSPLALPDAIHWVEAEAQGPDTLIRLEAASGLVGELAELGDAVLGYFVDQARHDGHSWTEIGDALGVSKQAAQQRHTVRTSQGPNAPTFEHFTPRARHVVSEAEEIARTWGHGYVGTEHLLLGLYREPDGVGARVLGSAGLSKKKAGAAVGQRVVRGTAKTTGDLTFTPRAVAVFTNALSSALAMKNNYIGTEHLLLGLVQGDGVAAEVLQESGVAEGAVMQGIERALASFGRPRRSTKDAPKGTSAKKVAPKKSASARKTT